ncbi:MAG: hypothetical protein GF353_13965 [Candidatus Lokiarchaeota archaeon]|nr:hypothetical protein [Candidatus Lokiarchaeota archaeon]
MIKFFIHFKYLVLLNIIYFVMIGQNIVKIYEAQTTIISLEENHIMLYKSLSQSYTQQSNLCYQIQNIDFSNANIAILKSRKIKTAIIEKYNLMKVYHVNNIYKAIKRLDNRTKIKNNCDRVISIKVIDNSSERAAEIANEYVNQLSKVTKEIVKSTFAKNAKKIVFKLEESKQEVLDFIDSLTFKNDYDSELRIPIKSLINCNYYSDHTNLKSTFRKSPSIKRWVEINDLHYCFTSRARQLIGELERKVANYTYMINLYDTIDAKYSNNINNFYTLDKAVPPEKPLLHFDGNLFYIFIIYISANVVIILIVHSSQNIREQVAEKNDKH